MPIILKQQHEQHKKAKSLQQTNIKSVLQFLKSQSDKYLDNQQKNNVKSMLIMKQSLAYQLMLLSPQQYIAHQFTKVKNKQISNESVSAVDLLNRKFLLEYQLDGKAENIVIKNLNPLGMSQNLQSLNNGLKQKLSKINNNLTSINKGENKLNPSRSHTGQDKNNNHEQINRLMSINKKRTQEQINQLMQFKQASYWVKNQQKTNKIKQFLQYHQKQQQKLHKKHKQSIKKSMQRAQSQMQAQKYAKAQSMKQILKKGLERTLKYRQKRQISTDHHQNQLQRIQQFLQKINTNTASQNKRLYKILQDKHKQQMQRQRQRYQQKLSRIKQQHLPFDQEQLDEHIQKYQQHKQSLNQQSKQKRQQFQAQRQQIAQQLKNLFHSKRYDKIAQDVISPYKRSMSQIIERKTKKKDFSLSVIEKFKPNVSMKKRESLQNSIRQLMLTQDKTKKKVFKNGQYLYEQKTQIDGRKKGIQYLAFLRKYLQNKPRKQDRPNSTSVIEQNKNKKIDYLRDNKPNIKFKASMIQWKKVIDDPSFKAKDKYTFLKQSITTLEHKALEKQIQARNLKKSSQELQKKEQFDKLYLESIQAKMAILNDLMLSKKDSKK